MRNLLLLVVCFAISYTPGAFAQMTIENGLTAEEYIQDVLLGEGVSVSNVTINGLPANQVQPRVGYFNAEASNFYFDDGLLMATKNIQIATCGMEVGGSGSGSDPDLNQIITGSLYDVTVIEFDFVPQGDTLSFDYIFASREYHGYVCSNFNDVFGFFLSGPGITGPFTNNAVNIAVLPDGTPVTINNVNNGGSDFFGGGSGLPCSPPGGGSCPCNAAYFTDNGGGNGTNLHSDACFGGYTVPLVAQAIVQCGLTYHIKLAIANALDSGLDSGVFLKSRSFSSSSPIFVDLAVESGINDSTLVEGCGGATFYFNRETANTEQTIYITMGGTATNGVDYTLFPDSLVFPVGATQISFEIEAFHDGITEGLESVELMIENENVCGGESQFSVFTFYIDEYPELELTSHNGFIDCGAPIDLTVTATGGNPPYSYLWSTGETSPTITVSPISTTTFSVVVSESCGIYEETAFFEVEVMQYDTLLVDLGDPLSLTCLTDVLIEPEISGGSGAFTYAWYNNGTLSQTDLIWNTLPDGDGQLQLVVTDHCGNVASDVVQYETPPQSVDITLADDYYVSCLDNTSIPTAYSGGVGAYTFQWYVNGVLYDSIPSIQIQTDITSQVVVHIFDECGNTDSDEVMIYVPNIPLELTLSEDTTICVGGQARLSALASGGEEGFTYLWTPGNRTTPEIFVSPDDTTTYTVTATEICGKSISNEVTVNTSSVHAAFEMEYTGTTGVVFTNQSTPDVNYLWNFGDGFKSHLFEPVHEYYSPGTYNIMLQVTNELGCTDYVVHTYNPPAFIYIPTAFTPNADGLNEVFKATGVSVKSFKMRIYNRGGQLLFETNDINEGWDGSVNGSSYFAQNEVFVVQYEAESYSGERIERTGHVTIIR